LLGSPLTRDVVGFCADNFAAGGIIAKLVRGWQGDPLNDNVPLRLAGFAHYGALTNDAALQGFYESCGGIYDAAKRADLAVALEQLFSRKEAAARQFLRSTPQTNETGRGGHVAFGVFRDYQTSRPAFAFARNRGQRRIKLVFRPLSLSLRH
jgi:hypothetical protein